MQSQWVRRWQLKGYLGGRRSSFGCWTRQFRARIGAARCGVARRARDGRQPGFEHLFVILRCRGVAKADAVG